MKKHIALFGLLLSLFSPLLTASVSDEEVQALREQIRLLSQRLDQLENSRQTVRAAPAPASSTAPDERVLDEKIDQAIATRVDEKMTAVAWAERMRWSGDFRYRYENIDASDDRNRNRIRSRFLLQADVADNLRIGFGLASGNDDPVSSNQTLGGGGSSKQINLDLAYVQWSGWTNALLVGGKFNNQLYRAGDTGLLWDGDWRPEGASLLYNSGKFFAVGLGTWLESDSNKQQKEFSSGFQAGVKLPLGDHVLLTAGAGYYLFDTAGKRAFLSNGDFASNSFDAASQTYLFDYQEVEAFAELAFDVFGRPGKVFGDYVENQDADDNNKGYTLGFKYGKAKSRGTWDLSYAYRRLEADAVLGLLADSDFGDGGTDAKGSIFGATYAFHDNWNFQATYFLNKIDLASGHPQDLDRVQLDLNFKFK